MRRIGLRAAFLVGAVLLVARASSAQVAIAGVVRDTTGAIMPGVTVEASSPALIEKSRTAVTDTAGQYKIVDLSPGTYEVSFGPVKTGGRNFLQIAKVTFEIGVSRN